MTQMGDRAEAAPAGDALSKDRLRLWLRLLKVTRLVEAGLRERLRGEFATTLPRFDVLAALHRNEKGLRMSELSGVLRVSNGNVTGIVERLVAEGLIVRHAVEGDRRATVVRLTRKGREQFLEQAAAHEAWVSRMLAALDAEEAQSVTGALERVAGRIETGSATETGKREAER